MTRFRSGVARALLDRDGPLKITRQLSSATAAIAGGIAGGDAQRTVLREPSFREVEHAVYC